jgi:NarL family two-component system sensor histidine kinase YdfH
VVYHANASNLNVSLDYLEGQVQLRVQDDGMGFNPHQVDQSGHFGLSGMQERTRLAGGRLSVHSQKDRGTTVQLTI